MLVQFGRLGVACAQIAATSPRRSGNGSARPQNGEPGHFRRRDRER
jgi:hypothetical protein